MAFHLALNGTEVTVVLAKNLTAVFSREQILHNHPDQLPELIQVEISLLEPSSVIAQLENKRKGSPLSQRLCWLSSHPTKGTRWLNSFWRNWEILPKDKGLGDKAYSAKSSCQSSALSVQ